MTKSIQNSHHALLDTLLTCLEATINTLSQTLCNDTLLMIFKYSASKPLSKHITTTNSIEKYLKMSLTSIDSAMFYNDTNISKLMLENLEILMADIIPVLSIIFSELVDELNEFHEISYIIDTASIVELLKLKRVSNVLATIEDNVVPKLHTLLTKCNKYSTNFNSCKYFDLKNYKSDNILITDLIQDEELFNYKMEFENLEKTLELLILESYSGDDLKPLKDYYFDDKMFELDLEFDYQMSI